MLASHDCVTVGRSSRLYLTVEPITPRSVIARVRLCLTATTRQPRIGSLQALIRFDTTLARFVEARLPQPGSPMVHSASGGLIPVAGASNRGIAGGTLLLITFRLTARGMIPQIDLAAAEINGPDGGSLVSVTAVRGLSARCAVGVRCRPPSAATERVESCAVGFRGGPLRLRLLTPNEGSADAGAVDELTIIGCGFEARGNTVRFGDVVMRDVRATADGTRITITVPKVVPSTGEAPPMQIGPGSYSVTVTTGRGTSNALRFTLRQ